uniref:phenylalanine--tRNA ligase n=1 Tax=Dictyopteris divaricata TaxID=156996 RepID=A0A2I4Q2M8_9PHAE|nr:phenylalanyl tRNA synthetase beta subunit [Dictyopteris divaricata]YP_010205373.1 phenylalanyl tRNA synthetase beta subunit [Grateloupia livida]AQZ25084.1 phenylalanyl tRNA synthetase beta subunit [Dictyopteris divaricata]UAV85942.1 phenylalanyl tRNA synthetase beta subunit [Grateloupia livida]
MYVSLKWVEQIFRLKTLSLDLFIERLILAGFEVESIERKKNLNTIDIILDVSFTTNRADISNIKGFTVELFSLFKGEGLFQAPLNLKPLSLKFKGNKKKSFEPLFFTPQKNTNYQFLLKNINIVFTQQVDTVLLNYFIWEKYLQRKLFNPSFWHPNFSTHSQDYLPILQNKSNSFDTIDSPLWIKKRLSIMNFKSINNVIDTLNYILIETGQVFFAYDINSLKNFTKTSRLDFTVKLANETDKFLLSKFDNLNLTDDILTIANNNKIISILGIIQDYNTIVTKKTSQFLLETSIYDSEKIKKISKKLGLRTEYSIKLEKQIDLNILEHAYFRLIYLFKIQGITFEETIKKKSDFILGSNSKLQLEYLKNSNCKIKVFYKNINRLVGPAKKTSKLKSIEFLNCLKTLNFRICYRTDKSFTVVVPFDRQSDIEQEVDIVEEIVRVIGFNYFHPVLPNKNRLGKITKLEKLKRRLRTSFLNIGFTETIHSIFSKETFISEIFLQNPIVNESLSLRVSLLKTLLKKISFNQTTARKNFETFEFGRVYKSINKLTVKREELELISGVFGGELFRSNWEQTASPINWFEAKGLLENIFKILNISISWLPIELQISTIFHPIRTANIFIDSQIIGTFGQIHPNFALKNGLTKHLYLFEFNLEILNKFWNCKTAVEYSPYSSYPISYVDLTCIINIKLPFDRIKEKILRVGQPLLKSIELFDYYHQPPIKKGYCSLSFKLGFNSSSRTLLSSEVDLIMGKVIHCLEKNFDIEFN